jgi:hypothetical protein
MAEENLLKNKSEDSGSLLERVRGLLRKREEEIQELKKIKVELEDAKNVLEIKVVDRTKKLQEKIEELEKITELLEKEKKKQQELSQTLEVKVGARTAELNQEKANLETKVAERTKELQEKMEEMERFQKFVVGRELKMVELKQEIKKLGEEKEQDKTH